MSRTPARWVLATVFLCLSFTPSLLPRTWLTQAVLSGLTAATGYLLGRLLGGLARRWRRQASPAWLFRAYAWSAGPAVLVFLVLGWRWQSSLAGEMGMAAPSVTGWLAVLPVAATLAVALIGGVQLAVRAVAGLVDRHAALRWLVVALAAAYTVVPAGPALDLADRSFEAVDGPAHGVTRPTDPDRSGSPASLVSWSSLDKHGREFVTATPPAATPSAGTGTAGSPRAWAAVSGAPAAGSVRPIRVYVGVRSAADDRGRARLAVAELQRTGAFSRRVLCIVVPTGTGWVDEPTVAALEAQTGGDSALVTVQYSALPSWLSFLTAPDRARTSATALFDEVHRVWSQLPPSSRPRLLIYGNSLGALAAQAPFGSLDDLLAKADGALLAGPPNGSALWRDAVAARDPGSTESAPRLAAEPAVRFARGTADLGCAGTPPRVLFLQHPTDPVVYWSPRLLVQRPDWLREPRATGVLPAVHWYPLVTFWQLSADMLAALNVPGGYGHRYNAEAARAWALLTASPSAACAPAPA